MTTTRELLTDDDFESAFEVMRELRPHLDLSKYLELLAEMRPRGYRLIAAEADDKIVGLAGIGQGVNFYYGHYIWVYDLITAETERSKGHGLILLQYVEQLARDSGCETLALSSAVFRKDAHRFYLEKASMEMPGHVFVKDLR